MGGKVRVKNCAEVSDAAHMAPFRTIKPIPISVARASGRL